MIKRWFWLECAILALLLPAFISASAKTGFFRVEDLQPGMKGIGKTCFQGTKPEEFQVEILGVLRGIKPGANAVLAKFSGGAIDKIGIFEGMSGSPVYIDGKLLGAVAFSYAFAKEAIGGITPITQMVDAFNEPTLPSLGDNVIINKSSFWNFRLPLPVRLNQSIEMPISLGNLQRESALASFTFGGHSLIPIATPLSLGGFHAETLKMLTPQLRAMNMSILQGVGSAAIGGATAKPAAHDATASEGPPFEPGSNLVISLIRGDLDVSAGGTVTYIDGNRLYAFGHSLMELGFTELPMQKARAIKVFPSIESSFKILETGEAAGAIRQDRGMGVYGIVGEKAQMVPMRIHLATSRGITKEFRYELARDALLTPLLVNAGVYNTIVSSERGKGSVTLKVKGKISINGERPVELNSRFSSDGGAPSSASLSVAIPVNYLMSAGYKNLDLQNIDLDISVQEKDKSATLDSVRIARLEVKAGESVEVEISYKKEDGEMIRDAYPVKIPENVSPGPLMMLVADGASMMSADEEAEAQNMIPRDLTQLIRIINNIRKNDRLYVRFFRQEAGVVVKGEGMPGLPPSILSILKSDRKAGTIIPIRTSALSEYELPASDSMIAGSKSLRLLVKP
jgi:hypothetical protein